MDNEEESRKQRERKRKRDWYHRQKAKKKATNSPAILDKEFNAVSTARAFLPELLIQLQDATKTGRSAAERIEARRAIIRIASIEGLPQPDEVLPSIRCVTYKLGADGMTVPLNQQRDNK